MLTILGVQVLECGLVDKTVEFEMIVERLSKTLRSHLSIFKALQETFVFPFLNGELTVKSNRYFVEVNLQWSIHVVGEVW